MKNEIFMLIFDYIEKGWIHEIYDKSSKNIEKGVLSPFF